MAHDTTINVGSGGDVIYTYDIATGGAYPTTGKVSGGVVLVSATNTTAPTPVTATNGLYVQPATSSTWAVSAASLPLPTGAALEAGGHLAAIDTSTAKIPAQGQALAAASMPVVLTAIQQAALTPPAAITGFALDATMSAASAKLPAALGQHAMSASLSVAIASDQGAVPVSLASLPALAAGTATIGNVNAIPAGDVIEIGGTTYTVQRAFANASASGETTVVAATAGKQIRVLAYKIGPVSAAVNVFFDNPTNGAISSTCYFLANGGMGRSMNLYGHFQTGTQNEALRINLSATANVGVDVTYILF